MPSGSSRDSEAVNVPEPATVRMQEQLARVLRSSVFRRSEQQRALLSYLAQKSIDGQGDELKEYSVGVDALGKRQDYDPRKDATVRIQIGKLRSKLDEYFRTEGLHDPILFNLPKGGFKILFEERGEAEVGESLPLPPTLDAVKAFADARILRRLCVALGILLVVAAGVIAYLARAQWLLRHSAELQARVWTPALESIWHPFLEEGRQLTLSLGTPLFVNLDNIPVRDPSVNEWREGPLSPRLELMRKAVQATDIHPNYGYNGFGETVGALRLYRLFLARGKDVTFRRSNNLSWDDFRERNLILLGSPKSVIHLRNFRDLQTKLAFDIEDHQIVNYNPRPGEQPSYRKPDASDSVFNGYALVTRLPGVDGAGNIMILGSPDTQGTRAACEYVTNPATAIELAQRFGSKGGELPAAYQVLLKITSRTDVPLVITAIAHRELKAH